MALEPAAGWRQRIARGALVATAATCLVTGIWGGLARLYWTLVPLTSLNVNWVTLHGSLMVCGFLGTLIAVERAAAIHRWWASPGPATTAAGGVLLIAGFLAVLPPVLFVLGAASLSGLTLSVLFRHPSISCNVGAK